MRDEVAWVLPAEVRSRGLGREIGGDERSVLRTDVVPRSLCRRGQLDDVGAAVKRSHRARVRFGERRGHRSGGGSRTFVEESAGGTTQHVAQGWEHDAEQRGRGDVRPSNRGGGRRGVHIFTIGCGSPFGMRTNPLALPIVPFARPLAIKPSARSATLGLSELIVRRPCRLAWSRTRPFHGRNAGSNPARVIGLPQF